MIGEQATSARARATDEERSALRDEKRQERLSKCSRNHLVPPFQPPGPRPLRFQQEFNRFNEWGSKATAEERDGHVFMVLGGPRTSWEASSREERFTSLDSTRLP